MTLRSREPHSTATTSKGTAVFVIAEVYEATVSWRAVGRRLVKHQAAVLYDVANLVVSDPCRCADSVMSTDIPPPNCRTVYHE